jgi:ribosome-associated translation inhibitor RaiA
MRKLFEMRRLHIIHQAFGSAMEKLARRLRKIQKKLNVYSIELSETSEKH